MRRLRRLLFLVHVRRFRQVLGTVLAADEFAQLRDRIIRNTGGIGAHVGDEANRAFLAQFHAFVEVLREHHGALHAEAQLARGVLLQLAGGEGRSRAAPALPFFHRADRPLGLLQRRADLLRFFGVGDLGLFVAAADEARVERRGLGGRQVRVDGPVFLLLEGLDLALALDDQAQRDGLHAAGGEPAAHLVPQQRRDLIPDQAVENAASLLRVHQVLVDLARMQEGLLHRTLGDLVERNAMEGDAVAAFLLLAAGAVFGELFREMGGDGLALAVGVGRQVHGRRRLRQLLQLGDHLLLAGNDHVIRLEVVLDVHAQDALGQVLHVAERGLDFVVVPQVLVDRLRLGRRFDDDQRFDQLPLPPRGSQSKLARFRLKPQVTLRKLGSWLLALGFWLLALGF